MKRLCVYSAIGLREQQILGEYIPQALRMHKDTFGELVFVGDIRPGDPHFKQITTLADRIVPYSKPIWWPLMGYKAALAALTADELAAYDEVVFTDSTVYLISPLDSVVSNPVLEAADFWSIGYFLGEGDWRIADQIKLERVMTPNLWSVKKNILPSAAFQSFMQSNFAFDDYLQYRVQGEHGLHRALTTAGFSWASYLDPAAFHTIEPLVFEAPDTILAGSPIVSKNIFTLDPLTIDMQAIDCRETLNAIRSTTKFDTRLIFESLLPFYPLRQLQSNVDDLRIIDARSTSPPTKSKWNFRGKIAVVAHIYYVEVVDEFIELARNMPCEFDFLATTSNEENRQGILAKLEKLDFGGKIEVRVVEENRGRDMSSLFITFRDVMLSGRYAWALRLHSKRTPQMSWQIGNSFKRHLTQNLIPSKAFVAQLFDFLEKPENDDVGVIIPPVVHIGFGTLGHSWNNNRSALEEIAKEMGITVPLDEDTPVAAYGTMYWFRPDAIRPMFEREWRWDQYNPEPHHIDGGLAHVQERLICYCAQQRRFRTLAVMSTEQAERNYLKLEYKLQRLAAHFPTRDIRQQCSLADRTVWPHGNMYSKFLSSLERMDGAVKKATPTLWQLSRPIVLFFWRILTRFGQPAAD
jgi:rhamnosyltransferase